MLPEAVHHHPVTLDALPFSVAGLGPAKPFVDFNVAARAGNHNFGVVAVSPSRRISDSRVFCRVQREGLAVVVDNPASFNGAYQKPIC